mgnify:CR=1 FL=1
MKVIAWYLPQFHVIPENDKWWGKGFTEWVNVKKAVPLDKDHNQPRVPLNNNYYNLLDDDVKMWQVNLAKRYGIYGFCIHHYWFDGKLLLEKPLEQYLANKTLDLPFCICWANEHWTNQWASSSEKILIEQRYGKDKEWKQHFDYLLPFFNDSRYIKENGKPLFVIYRPELIECLNDMIDYWQELAIESGLPGIVFAYQGFKWDYVKNKDDSRFTYDIEYQPTLYWNEARQKTLAVRIQDCLPAWLMKMFAKPLNCIKGVIANHETVTEHVQDYDELWEKVLSHEPANDKCIPGVFVDWDNTPRKGERGIYLKGVSPIKFQKYFERTLEKAKKIYKKDYVFVFSWNEWAEGGYLEPDEKNGYGYLEAIKCALERYGE